MRSLLTTELQVSVVVLLFLVGAPAAAYCVGEPSGVVWTYPAEGDTVPVDATFWALPSLGTQAPNVSIIGVGAAVALDSWSYEPPALEPGTDYTLLFRMERGGGVVEHSVAFSTSLDPAVERGQAAAPTVRGHDVLTTPDLSPGCLRVLRAADCYDTGQDRHLRLDVAGSAKLWLMRPAYEDAVGRQIVWPAECGGPLHFTQGTPTGEDGELEVEGCYDVVAVDDAGRRSATARYCTSSAEGEGVDAPGLSCGGAGSGGSLWAVPLALLGCCRRVRRRAAGS